MVSHDGPTESSVTCDGGMHDCNGACVNEQNDPNHCGSCSKVCPGPDAGTGMAQCSAGMCSVQCGGATTLDCSGTCYDPTDTEHCGSCSNACTAPSNGSATCSGSPLACGFACNSNFHQCGSACDSNSDPPSNTGDTCIISDTFGIFVKPGGTDSSSCGAMASPCLTIGHAMDQAKAAGKRVYACGSGGATYNENLVVGTSRDGVAVYGGLDCTAAQWTYNAADVATVAPSTGIALELSGLTSATFEDFAFVGTASSSAGASSIAVFASNSSGVVLRRCSATAGAGAAGEDGVQPGPYSGTAPSGNPGAAPISSGGTGNGGATQPNSACSTSWGGAGGSARAGQLDGQSGEPGANNAGTSVACNGVPGQGGGSGAGGAVGSPGAGASTWATLSSSGWAPSAGQSGSAGAVGQGGGGGGAAGALNAIGGAGGGGAGGCGGAGGPPGTGGGSSIAVLLYQSSVDLETYTLTSASAGRGGNGAAGQAGQTGGGPGSGNTASCSGGAGGSGGNGGPAGGGAGGVSAGVVFFGTAPKINGVTVSATTATLSGITTGTAGVGGTGAGASNAGTAGAQDAVLLFP